MVELMIEKFDVKRLMLALQPKLTLYAIGRTYGVVVDSGDDNTIINTI